MNEKPSFFDRWEKVVKQTKLNTRKPMKPKKPTRVRATRGWICHDDGNPCQWNGMEGSVAVAIRETGCCDTPVIILDARDHADQQRELRRLRRENKAQQEMIKSLNACIDQWKQDWKAHVEHAKGRAR